VSIIMPVFNSSRFIGSAIFSVLEQTYQDWELIICDDESSDNSLVIAQEFSVSDSRISVIENRYSKGAPGARNSCLDVAEGRYIAFLDADDLWIPSKLELQIAFMSSNNYSFSYSYHQIMNENGDFVSECRAPESVDARLMRVSNFIPCLTAVYDSYVLGKVYQPFILKRNDFALWLKILNSGKVQRAYCLPVSTAQYRANSYGLSSNKLDALKYFNRCLTEYGNCNLFEACIYSSLYLLVVVIKKKLNFLYNFFVVKI
jgi:teichuronic acid biosynthesis glycosyltransferase TuaG